MIQIIYNAHLVIAHFICNNKDIVYWNAFQDITNLVIIHVNYAIVHVKLVKILQQHARLAILIIIFNMQQALQLRDFATLNVNQLIMLVEEYVKIVIQLARIVLLDQILHVLVVQQEDIF